MVINRVPLPQALVDAQEVDLNHLNGLLVDTKRLRNGRYEGYKLAASFGTNSAVPLRQPARNLESPREKLRRVVEPEHVVLVLYVIFCEKSVQLFELFGIVQIHIGPGEGIREGVRLSTDLNKVIDIKTR